MPLALRFRRPLGVGPGTKRKAYLVLVLALSDTSAAFFYHGTTHAFRPQSSALLASIKSSSSSSDLQEVKRNHRISLLCKGIGMAEDQANKLLDKRPQLLRYSETKMIKTTDFFFFEIGLSKEEYIKMISLYPNVFMYSVDKRLRPTVAFFRDEIGSSKWKWIACRYPQIFSHSVDITLRPRASFMIESLGLERRADLAHIASKFPPVFWLPECNILSKMAYLKEALELSTSELRNVLVTFPQVLGLSLEKNLQPTIEFLLSEDGAELDVKYLKYFVLYQPALLAYSLDNRIRPRIRRMKASGISFAYSPPTIMSYTNNAFDEWLEDQTASWSISD